MTHWGLRCCGVCERSACSLAPESAAVERVEMWRTRCGVSSTSSLHSHLQCAHFHYPGNADSTSRFTSTLQLFNAPGLEPLWNIPSYTGQPRRQAAGNHARDQADTPLLRLTDGRFSDHPCALQLGPLFLTSFMHFLTVLPPLALCWTVACFLDSRRS